MGESEREFSILGQQIQIIQYIISNTELKKKVSG
jgi:hypothetical protein